MRCKVNFYRCGIEREHAYVLGGGIARGGRINTRFGVPMRGWVFMIGVWFFVLRVVVGEELP